MKQYWEVYKRIVRRVGDFQASVIFSVLYYLMVVPLGLTVGWMRDDLRLRKAPGWTQVRWRSMTLNDLEDQY